jgi:type VI secretion system protein ImpA
VTDATIETLLAPLAGPEPGGRDLRYDGVLDEIAEAMRHDDGAAQGDWVEVRKRADHPRAVRLATEALTDRTKDLRVAAWLAHALIHTDGFRGLARGLDVLRGLVDDLWEHVHPLPDDGDFEVRAAPLARIGNWEPVLIAVRDVPLTGEGHGLAAYDASRALGTEAAADTQQKKKQREKLVADGALTPEAFDAAFARTPRAWYEETWKGLRAAQRALNALGEATTRRFPAASAPSFHGLRESLEQVSRTLVRLRDRKRELEPGPVEDDPADVAAAADEVPAGGYAIPTDRPGAIEAIMLALRAWQQATPVDPVPYVVTRTLRWGEAITADGISAALLEPPPPGVRSELRSLFLNRQWAQLLVVAERGAGEPYGRGWLDLQRYVLAACEGLGRDYGAVGEAIEGQLRALLARAPQLVDATLLDDTPAASAETRQWLQPLLLEATTGAAPASRADDPLERATLEARAGRPERAVALLMQALGSADSPRTRFLTRTRMARVMVDAGQHAVALPILRECIRIIEAHRLEEWEQSEAIAEPMALLYRALAALEQDAQERERLYQRLCLLDAVRAMALVKGSGA